jgi:hypothetical protein
MNMRKLFTESKDKTAFLCSYSVEEKPFESIWRWWWWWKYATYARININLMVGSRLNNNTKIPS